MNALFTPVIFNSDRQTLQLQTSASHVIEKLEPRYSKIFQVLQDENDMKLQAYVIPTLSQKPPKNQAKKSFKKLTPSDFRSLFLSVVLYEPMKTFEAVEEFFEQCSKFLQSSLHCDRNVPYRNSQSLSATDVNPSLTFQLKAKFCLSQIEILMQASNPSAALKTEDALRETQASSPIKASLYK